VAVGTTILLNGNNSTMVVIAVVVSLVALAIVGVVGFLVYRQGGAITLLVPIQ
jgi:hypothetical protein